MDPRDKTYSTIRGTTTELRAAAKALRQAMTPAEKVLWEALRERRVNGLKFRCQHPVGPFVLDFYCPALKLAVEVDGGIHDEQAEQDAARTQHLNGYGYRVLRFRNEDVLTDLPSVLNQIARVALHIETTLGQRIRRRRSAPPAPQSWGEDDGAPQRLVGSG